MANSYTDAETVSALDRERQFRARSGDFAIWSFQPVRQALGEWPVFAHSRRLVQRTLRIAAVDVTVEREAETDPGSASGGIAVAVDARTQLRDQSQLPVPSTRPMHSRQKSAFERFGNVVVVIIGLLRKRSCGEVIASPNSA
jgi:hypothetical protein